MVIIRVDEVLSDWLQRSKLFILRKAGRKQFIDGFYGLPSLLDTKNPQKNGSCKTSLQDPFEELALNRQHLSAL